MDTQLKLEDFTNLDQGNKFRVMMQSDPHQHSICPNLKLVNTYVTPEMFKDLVVMEHVTPECKMPKVRLKEPTLSKKHFYGEQPGKYLNFGKYLVLEYLTPNHPAYLEPEPTPPTISMQRVTDGSVREVKLKVVVLDEYELKDYVVVRLNADEPPSVWKFGKPDAISQVAGRGMRVGKFDSDKFDLAVKHIATSMHPDDSVMLTLDGNFSPISYGMMEYYKEVVTMDQWKLMLENFSDTAVVVDEHRVDKDGFVPYPSPCSFAEFTFNYLVQLYKVANYAKLFELCAKS